MIISGPGNTKKILLILTIICIVSRIPQLISDKLLLDGDECVVAIMAKHMLNGQGFPLFFYGQYYGFSLVECLSIIPFYVIAGITSISVKTGMLLLWTTGVLFMYRSFVQINTRHKWLPLILTLILIWSPAWAVWAMKARGGYLTSFTLTAIIFCLLFRREKRSRTFFILGCLFFLVYQSQPLWLPGAVPFLVFFLWQEKKRSHLLAFSFPVLVLAAVFFFYKQNMGEFGNAYAPVHIPTTDLLVRIQRIPVYLYDSLHGNYFFEHVQPPNFFCAVFAIVFEILVFSLLAMALYNVGTNKEGTLLFNVSALSLFCTVGYSFFSYYIHPRYLLPVTGYTLISLLLLLNTITVSRTVIYRSAGVLIVAGVMSLISFYDFDYSAVREKQLHAVIKYLTGKGIHYAYSNDNLFTWELIFYSNEQVICHERQSPGRYPKYFHDVDSAYDHGDKTVFIIPPGGFNDIPFENYTDVEGYLMIIDPPKDKITRYFREFAK